MQLSHPLRQALQRNALFARRVIARLIGRTAARREHPVLRRWNRIKKCAFAQEIVALAIAALASEAHMHRILFAVALGICTGGALAQTGGAPCRRVLNRLELRRPVRPALPHQRRLSRGQQRHPLRHRRRPRDRGDPRRRALPRPRLQEPPGRRLRPVRPRQEPQRRPTPNCQPQPRVALPARHSGPERTQSPSNQTHISKAEWSRTCRRIENRLQTPHVENMDVDVSGPKPRRIGKSPGSG
jgi:hypothetical protein